VTGRLVPFVVSLAVVAAAAQSPIVNAKVERRQAARPLPSEVQAVADSGAAAWIGYRVPMVARANWRLQATGVRATCRLEPPTELVVMVRVESKVIAELRPLSVDCDVDAAGMPLIWLDGVNPEQSVAWLSTIVSQGAAGQGSRRLLDPALNAIGLHASPAAPRALTAFAKDGSTTHLRGQALVWLAQHASAQAGPVIADAIERDPELEVKRRAVTALGQLPRDEGVPLLINVARTHKSTEVRRQAMQTLGQTNDARAVAFFEDVLLK
jgi:hypothetical protein